jgi:mRNA interferase MazF
MVDDATYCPSAGDIIWIEFGPTVANEQTGRRPAIILSARVFNELTGRRAACPITSRGRGWALEVGLPPELTVIGTVMVDQLRVLSWRERFSKFACAAPPSILDEIRAKTATLLGIDID